MVGIQCQWSLFAAGVSCLYCVWRLREWHKTRSSGLKDIPGPDSESCSMGSFSYTLPMCLPTHRFFSIGNMRQLFQSEVGEMDFQWQEQYGGIMRIKGPFGVSSRCYLIDWHCNTDLICAIVGGPSVGGRYQGCASYPSGIQLGERSRPKGTRTVGHWSRNPVGRW